MVSTHLTENYLHCQIKQSAYPKKHQYEQTETKFNIEKPESQYKSYFYINFYELTESLLKLKLELGRN